MANFQIKNNSNTSREISNTIQSENICYTCVNCIHTLKQFIKALYYKSDFYIAVYTNLSTNLSL